MPLYFEDLHEGLRIDTPARTITESDVVAFSAWTGDYNALHTDVEFAAGTRFGERIAHGVLGLSYTIGLMARTAAFEGSAVALLSVDDWRFLGPIRIGDTIRVRITVAGLRLTSDGQRGIVIREFDLLNQRDELVQQGRLTGMIAVGPRGTGEKKTADATHGS